MKLDKIKFARLVEFVMEAKNCASLDLHELDSICDIDIPEGEKVYPLNGQIEQLMAEMAKGTSKIEAIRCHRAITGMGLKESKDIVEKYWYIKRTKQELYDKLNALGKSPDEDELIAKFINDCF